MPPDREESALATFEDARTAGKTPNAALQLAIAQFPDCASLLTDHALSFVAESNEMLQISESDMTARIESRADAIIAKRFQTSRAMTGILSAANERGLGLVELSSTLALARSVIMKLDRRLVDAASIPTGVITKIATAIGQHADAVRAYLQLPPSLASASDYKASSTPSVGDKPRESFLSALDVAVSSGEMTTEERDLWLDPGDR